MPQDDPQPEDVSVEEALTRLKAARELAWRATDSASLSADQRRKADVVARSLTEEIERILIDEMTNRSKVYDDAAGVMPDLVAPLRDAKKAVEKIIASVKDARKFVSVIDEALAIALRFI